VSLYFLFKALVQAPDEDTLEERYNSFVTSAIYGSYPKFRKYLGMVWETRRDWAQCFRQNLPVRGSNTTNYVEIVFRVLKDNIFERTQAFNLTQLVDFILTRYETYAMQRLIDFANGRYMKSLLRNMLPNTAGVESTDIEEASSDLGIFFVRSQMTRVAKGNQVTSVAEEDGDENSEQQVYTVDVVRVYCSCFVGNAGKLCKHALAVFVHLDRHVATSYNIADTPTRTLMFQMACGSTFPDGWLDRLTEPLDPRD